MTEKHVPPEAELFIRADGLADPNGSAGRLKAGSIISVAARLQEKFPQGTAEELRDWLDKFEKTFPDHFRPHSFRGDLSKLTSKQKFDVANGIDPFPNLNSLKRGGQK
jgi:hypothetical protein